MKEYVLYLISQSCPVLCDPMDCSPPGSSVRGDSPDKNTGVGFHALLQGISEPRSPTLQVDSLPFDPQGKPMNTGVGSLSLLQGNFPSQELNQSLPNCRLILYQLSYSKVFERLSVSSVAQSCLTLCDPMNRSKPGLPVHHKLPEFTHTHAHRVSDAIQPSSSAIPFSSCPQSLPESGSFPMSQLLQ